MYSIGKLVAAFSLVVLSGCAGPNLQQQISAASEGRALERMADNLSSKASLGQCSIIKTGGIFQSGSSVTVNCP